MNEQAEQIMPVIVELPAEIDVTNSDDVHQRLVAAMEPGVGTVIANLTATSFCDSSGVRAVMCAHETAVARNIRLQLAVSPDGSVSRVFQLTGVSTLMPLYASLEEAIKAS